MRATFYLIGMICFAIATLAGIIGLMVDKGHWTQVVIPLALLIGVFALWWQARAKTKRRL